MALFDFGDKARSRVMEALRDAEDRLMELDEIEGTDLSFHIKKEAERARIFLLRIRELETTLIAKTDRLMIAVVVGFIILFVKGLIGPQDIANLMKWL